MKEVIDLKEKAIYIIQNEKKTRIIHKMFGEDRKIWKNGKVLEIE